MKRTSIISNSFIYFHKYYIFSFFTKSNLNEETNPFFDKEEIAYISVACFFLSLKINNFLFSIDFIIDTFCKIENKNFSEEEKNKIKQKIFSYEFDILVAINFSFEDILPYNFLKTVMGLISPEILKIIKKENINFLINNEINIENNDENKIKIIKGKIAEIVNLSYLFPFFLKYNSETIALSCIKLSLEQFKINLKIKEIIDILSNNQKEAKISIDIIDINDIEICSSLIDNFVISKIKIVSPSIINNKNSEQNDVTKGKIEPKEKSSNLTDKKFLAKKRKTFHE